MTIRVDRYRRRDGTPVRSYVRRGNPDRDDDMDVFEIVRKTAEVYGKVKNMENFILGSKEERYNIALEQAMSLMPYGKAVIIAEKVANEFVNSGGRRLF